MMFGKAYGYREETMTSYENTSYSINKKHISTIFIAQVNTMATLVTDAMTELAQTITMRCVLMTEI